MTDDETITQKVDRKIAQMQADKPQSWARRHVIELALGGVLSALALMALAGVLSYMDTRHVQRTEMIDAKIFELDDQISTLQEYEQSDPASKYSPARQAGIRRKEAQKQALERQLERIKQ